MYIKTTATEKISHSPHREANPKNKHKGLNSIEISPGELACPGPCPLFVEKRDLQVLGRWRRGASMKGIQTRMTFSR